MNVLLRHRLRDEHYICIKRDRFANELFVRHLTSEIERFDHVVALQPEMTGVTLHIHDCVDSDRMRIGSGARSDHFNFAPEPLAYHGVRLLHAHNVHIDRLDFNLRIIDSLFVRPIGDKKRETLVKRFMPRDQRIRQSHGKHDFSCGFDGTIAIGHGQRETHLNATVIHRVTVRFHSVFSRHRVFSLMFRYPMFHITFTPLVAPS